MLNSLPVGARKVHFSRLDPQDVFCHVCPRDRQTLQHLLFDCLLAQQVWLDFASLFELSYASISLSNVLFSWPTGASSFLGRAFGYRLQAGHAVAIHTLWSASVAASRRQVPASRVSISAQFRTALRRHFSTLRSSSRWSVCLGDLPFHLLA